MVFSYYPGCTLKTRAKDLDRYARLCAAKLGAELEELPDWQCCGGVYPTAKDEIATKLSSVRALNSAKEKGNELVTVCSACHNVIKQTNYMMQTDEKSAKKVNLYLGLDEEYKGETTVLHYLEMLRDRIGFDKIKEATVNPLKGKKIAPYYGCLLLRPSKAMQFDDPENPTIMEDFIKAIGATPVTYAMRNECCGGYITLEDKGSATKKATAVTDNARANGAEMIITACPLCMYNLNKNAEGDMPVKYFTEVLAEALGIE